MTGWQNRIVGEGVEEAGQFLANPQNWRIHPGAQQDALAGVLNEVGWVQRIIVNQRTGHVVDGHLRVHLALAQGEKTLVPVLYVDLSPEEESLILATLDPIAAMAIPDQEKLATLLAELNTSSESLKEILTKIEVGDIGQSDVIVNDAVESPYTKKISVPIYEPKGEEPPLSALMDRTKTAALMTEIDAAGIPGDVAEFLRFAAERHTVFHFRQIAEFYCHADAKVQDLMERSGLVLIDFQKAIEYGFVQLTTRLCKLADLEKVEAGDDDA